jgi:hypothetical protein
LIWDLCAISLANFPVIAAKSENKTKHDTWLKTNALLSRQFPIRDRFAADRWNRL